MDVSPLGSATRLLPVDIADLAARFAADGYAELTSAFSQTLREQVAVHVAAALDAGGRRRDLRISVTGDSPRRYRLAGRAAVEASGSFLPRLYRDAELRRLIAAVGRTSVTSVPYAPEEYIATRFEEAGDTHGWHWDDYRYALIWVTAAPSETDGGTLEFIAEVPWNKTDPRVEAYVASRKIARRHPASGSVYLLRADTMLHRVTPLARSVRREILCFSYAAEDDLARDISHETLEQLYATV